MTVSASKDVAVINLAPTVTITATDAGGDTVTCTIAWGNRLATAANGCAGSHTWITAGTYVVTVTATDDDGATSAAPSW